VEIPLNLSIVVVCLYSHASKLNLGILDFCYRDAMITPDGYIFDKESILSYIVEQKKAQKRQMKAYEKYLEMEEAKKKMVCIKTI
jgi:hypothetical protein